jgi:hypothetical protein
MLNLVVSRETARILKVNIKCTIKKKVNWNDHILRRDCFIKHVFEGKIFGRIEVTGRRKKRRKQLLILRKREDTGN